MVTDALLNVVLGLFGMVFSILPDITIDVTSSMYVTFTEIVAGIVYLLPTRTIMSIMSLVLTILAFKIFIAIPKAIWGVLPFA